MATSWGSSSNVAILGSRISIRGGIGLALWEVSDVTEALALEATPRSGLSVMIAVRVETPDAVDVLHDELVSKGVSIVQPPTTHPWNARTTYFKDPDGHLWELYSWIDNPRTL
jgi:uncharacterized glyoxalase superfamily protein PhnB